MRRHSSSSSDERPETLWILRRPPRPDGPPDSRTAWRMIARSSSLGRPRVMVEIPGEDVFRSRLRAEVRGRRFAAIFVVDGAVRRCLPWARQAAPGARVVAVLTGERQLDERPRAGISERRRRLDAARRALAQADEVWCRDGQTLRAARALMRGVPSPALGPVPPVRTWLRRRAAARGFPAVEAIVLGRADEERVGAALKRVSARRANARRAAARGEDAVAALNAALDAARAPLVWLCLDGFEAPDEPLLLALADGLASRPYAGGAAPLSAPLVAGRGAAHFRAAWAISRKGDWHEAGHLSHFCCLLLRRDALRAAGGLDERLASVDAALIDLSLRLSLAGRPIFEARDALVRCPAPPPRIDASDREALSGKWSSGALRLLESLATALEPRGYRTDPAVRAGFQGT